MENRIVKGHLPACILTAEFMQRLQDLIKQSGDAAWQAVIASGGKLVTNDDTEEEVRPTQTVHDWAELVNILSSVSRIDRLNLTVEIADKGAIAIAFRNFNKAAGSLVVTGSDEGWVAQTYERISNLFMAAANPSVNRLFSTLGYIMIHSVIPLSAAFIIVVVMLSLLIPGEYRRSELIWWITTIGILITLRLAYTLSDHLISYTLRQYPYIYWEK